MLTKQLSMGLSAVAIAALTATSAHADDGVNFKFSGYGTLAATFTDNDDLAFRSSISQSRGAGTRPDLGVDSRLGLQGVATFCHGFSATGQLLVQRRRENDTVDSNNDYSLGVEWLFAQYSATSNLDLRLGRVVLPVFMISDYRNVGYSQPWLRVPLELYGHMPLTYMDGGQVVWRIPAGDGTVTLQPYYGKSESNTSVSGSARKIASKYVYGFNAQLEWGDWLLRAGQIKSSLPFEFAPFAGYGDPSAARYDLKDIFTSVGVQYDNGKAVFIAEWGKRKENGLPAGATFLVPQFQTAYDYGMAGKPLAAEKAWWAGAGWRFGKVLPFVSYGYFKNTSVFLPDSWDSLNASVRWDFAPNMALKAQVGQHKAKDSSAFVTPGSSGAGKVTSFAVGLDFVF